MTWNIACTKMNAEEREDTRPEKNRKQKNYENFLHNQYCLSTLLKLRPGQDVRQRNT